MMKRWDHQQKALNLSFELDGIGIFFDIGCLSWDTKVKVNRGGCSREYTIESLYRLYNGVELRSNEKGFDHSKYITKIRALCGDQISLIGIKGVYRKGIKSLYRLACSRKYTNIKLTKDHEVYTKRGWIEAGNLISGDEIALDTLKKHQGKKTKKEKVKKNYQMCNVGPYHKYGRKIRRPYKSKKTGEDKTYYSYIVEYHRVLYEAQHNNIHIDTFIKETYNQQNTLKFIDPKKYHIHHKDHDHRNNVLYNLEKMTTKAHLKEHGNYSYFGHGTISWTKFVSLDYIGDEICYDIETERPYSNFVANNIVVHNCGKSRTAIDILRYRCASNSRLLRTLILAPKITLTNWKNEFKKFSKIHPYDVLVLDGPQKKRVDTLKKALGENLDKPKVLITNYEALQMNELFGLIEKWNPEVMTADEAHRIKNPASKRAKACIKLSDKARYRYALTGTPILNSAMDIFNIFRFIDKGESFGKNFYKFRSIWFEDKNAGMPSHKHFPDYQPRPHTYKDFHEIVSRKSILAKKSECLDLPPFTRKEVFVEMGPKQKKAYKELETSFIAYLDELNESGEPPAVVAQLAITKALRMQQIVSGFAKDDEGNIHTFDKVPRLDALKELLEDNVGQHKIIIWAVFKENYKQIASLLEEMKIGFVTLTGETKTKDRDENIRAFNEDEDCRVLIGNQGAGGIGLNLISSDLTIYYSKGFSLEQDLQSEGRNYRGGSEIHKSVTRIDLICEGSIDETINEALSKKQKIGKEILDYKGGKL